MSDHGEIERLVLEQHHVALQVSKALRELHDGILGDLSVSVTECDGFRTLSEAASTKGDTLEVWRSKDPHVFPRYVALSAYYTRSGDKKRREALTGLRCELDDLDGRLGVRLVVWLNAKIVGVSSQAIRMSIDNLPEGAREEWIPKGFISREFAVARGENAIASIVERAASAASELLTFASCLYEHTAEEIEQFVGDGETRDNRDD